MSMALQARVTELERQVAALEKMLGGIIVGRVAASAFEIEEKKGAQYDTTEPRVCSMLAAQKTLSLDKRKA